METIKKKVVRNLPTDNKFWIEEFGYDDFTKTKPLKIFRKQYFYTFHIILDGEGILLLNNKKYNLKAGNVFYVPINVEFSYFPCETNKWKYLWFIFKSKTAVELISKLNFSLLNPVNKIDNFESKKDIFYKFIIEAERNEKAVYMCQSMFLYALSFFAHGEINYEPDENYYLKRADEYIRNNCFSSDFKVSHVSSYIHLSTEYFSRLFKKERKIKVVDYVKDLRMEKASELLNDTDISIKEISSLCGYDDYSHFCKEFKRKYNITAKNFREM